MAALIITLILLLLILILAGRLRYLESQAVDRQLQAHVTQNAAKIKGARRFYLKTLYRSNPPLGLIRIVTIILTVIAGAALLWTVAAQLAVADVIPAGAADFLSDLFTTETAERNTAAWILAGSALLASGLRWYTIKALHTIQDAEDTGQMRDVYTTPRELRVKMDSTRQVQLVLIIIGAVMVALASQFNLYPADADTTADTSQSTAQSSASSASSQQSSANSTDTSNPAPKQDPHTPLGALQAAKDAPLSVADKLTDADRATLIFMAYWAMEGEDPATLFDRGTAGSDYYYHIIPNNGQPLYVFNSHTPSSNTTANMFVACVDNGDVWFYSLYNSPSQSPHLSDITALTTQNSSARPTDQPLANQSFRFRQMITLNYQQTGYARVHQILQNGYAMTL